MTDEEKAKELERGVETPKSEDETAPEKEAQSEEENVESEEQNSEEETDSQESTFTKQYENLKGDTPEEYARALEEAYKNSTAEALRLKKEQEDNAAILERARALLEGAPAEDKAAFDINALPEIQMLRAEQQSKMVEAFEGFSKRYPQARESDGFDAFQKASAGVSQAFLAANGRVPTYNELFEATAKVLNWSPSDKNARKDAALKEAGVSGNTTTSSPKLPSKTNVTADQLKVARMMLKPDVSAKTSDADLIKELETLQT